MNLQKATLSDLDKLTPLFDAYRIFYGYESDLKAAASFLRERLLNNDSEIFIALSDQGDLMGFVQLYPLLSSTRMKRLWLLNDLYISPEYRGQGISKSLIEKAKELCRLTSAAGLTLETAKTNDIGNSLYPATGFMVDEEHNYYYWDL